MHTCHPNVPNILADRFFLILLLLKLKAKKKKNQSCQKHFVNTKETRLHLTEKYHWILFVHCLTYKYSFI